MTLDNLDLQLVHALQINPRAPFTTVASTLKPRSTDAPGELVPKNRRKCLLSW